MKLIGILLLCVVFIAIDGCRDGIVEFTDESPSASLYISSFPDGADIYFNNTRTGKITPDSLVNIQPGSYYIRVSLPGVGDETSYVTVSSGEKKHINFLIH